MANTKTKNLKGGRKGFGHELKIVERYSILSEDFFNILKEMLASDEKADKKWAVEQLNKAYIKMIPQDLTTGGKPLNIRFDEPFNITSKTKQDSKEPSKV